MTKKGSSKNDFTDTAHDVWLAGLGALAAAGDEGEKLFRTLVARGRKVEGKVVKPVDKAGSTVRKTVKQVRTRAGKSLGSLQSAIDDSVSATLHTLGVPTRKEIAALSRRVERLTRAVDGKRNGRPARKKAAKKKASSRKRTAKKT